MIWYKSRFTREIDSYGVLCLSPFSLFPLNLNYKGWNLTKPSPRITIDAKEMIPIGQWVFPQGRVGSSPHPTLPCNNCYKRSQDAGRCFASETHTPCIPL